MDGVQSPGSGTQGDFLLSFSVFLSSHLGEMLIRTELNADHAELGQRASRLLDGFEYFY